MLHRDESVSGPWTLIGGIAVLLLTAFMVIIGWHASRDNTASTSAPATSGSSMRQMALPSTTGSGGARRSR